MYEAVDHPGSSFLCLLHPLSRTQEPQPLVPTFVQLEAVPRLVKRRLHRSSAQSGAGVFEQCSQPSGLPPRR